MHYRTIFALAAIFLIVAVIVPLVIFFIQAQNDLIIIQNPVGTQTSGNVTIPTPEQIAASHQTTLLIVLIIDIVFISLFLVTLYYGINHIHPTH